MGDVPLTDAARVAILPDTLRLAQAPLRSKYRKNLKKEIVKNLIRNKPAGTVIRAPEFAQAANVKSSPTMWAFVNGMVARGEITRVSVGPKSYSWTVPEDSKVIHEADKAADTQRSTLEGLYSSRDVSDTPTEKSAKAGVATYMPTANHVEHQAMQFSWAYPDNHNDLREFIKWLRSQI